MTKGFNLSDYKVYASGFAWKLNEKKFPYSMYRKIDLKEFIKKLKDETIVKQKKKSSGWVDIWELERIIDKLLGEDFIEKRNCNGCNKLYEIIDKSGFCSQKCHDSYYESNEEEN